MKRQETLRDAYSRYMAGESVAVDLNRDGTPVKVGSMIQADRGHIIVNDEYRRHGSDTYSVETGGAQW